jgi:phage baseplate assembly protein W
VSNLSQKKYVLTDNDLIKQDLMNIFMTKVGSRLMYPTYGCIVWNYLFSNLNAGDLQTISENITGIIKNDPRVSLLSIDLTPTQNTLTVTLTLQYVGTNQIDQMIINFDTESSIF